MIDKLNEELKEFNRTMTRVFHSHDGNIEAQENNIYSLKALSKSINDTLDGKITTEYLYHETKNLLNELRGHIDDN